MKTLNILAIVIVLIICIQIAIYWRRESLTVEQNYRKTVGYAFDRHAKAALAGALARERTYTPGRNTAEAANNALMLARLRQYHVAPNETDPVRRQQALQLAATDYYNAVDRVRQDPYAAIANDMGLPAPETILDQAQDYFAAMRLQEYEWQVEQARNQVRDARANMPNFFAPIAVVGDTQNVHDSAVVAHTRNLYQKLGTVVPSQPPDNIRQAIDSHPFESEQRRFDALTTYNKMMSGDLVTGLGGSEREILTRTFNRVMAPENAKNKTSLMNAFMDSLADSVEHGHLVCTTGRCTRVLNSLNVLDANPEIAKPPITMEMLRSEVLTKSGRILERELANAPEAVRAGYNQGADTPEVQEFEQRVRDQIADDVHKNYPDQPSELVNRVIQDAQAGV